MTEEFPAYNFYDELEIERRASMEAVRAAYTRLARIHHPDASGGGEASAERMVRINRAFKTLSNAERRRAYNAHLRRRRTSNRARALGELEDDHIYDPDLGYMQTAPRYEPRSDVNDGRPRCAHCGGTSLRIERRRKPRPSGGPLPGQDRALLRVCRACGKTTEFTELPRSSSGGGLFGRPHIARS